MGRDKKTAKGRLDKYYHMAKEQGYRSRAAFKLIQLNQKFSFLENSRVILDLCAAPGGWMQVASKYSPMSSIIIGVDLDPIRAIPRCIGLQEDITTEKCRAAIRREIKHFKADCVLHDGAPNVGRAWIQDAYDQVELSLKSLKLATDFLRQGGTFVTKVFRSRDYFALMWVLNKLFDKVHATKPSASRNVSAEIFVVCLGYKAPAKLDARLLDPKYIFEEVDSGPKVNLFARKTNKKLAAVGYKDNQSTTHESVTVSEFLKAQDALLILAECTEIVFDDENENDQLYKQDSLTTEEIKECLKDIKVLGKKELRQLLTWRKKLISKFEQLIDDEKEEEEKLKQQQQDDESGDEVIDIDGDLDITQEEKDQLEMQKKIEQVKENEKKKLKAKKKREERQKQKLRERALHEMGLPSNNIEQEDAELFSVLNLKSKKHMDDVLNNNTHDEIIFNDDDEQLLEFDDDSNNSNSSSSSIEEKEEEEGLYKRQRERELDDMYGNYKRLQTDEGKAQSKLNRLQKDKNQPKSKKIISTSGDIMNDEHKDNPLLVGKQHFSKMDKIDQWYKQTEFDELLSNSEKEEEDKEIERKLKKYELKINNTNASNLHEDDYSDQDSDIDMPEEDMILKLKNEKKRNKKKKIQSLGEFGFETVPIVNKDDDDTDEDSNNNNNNNNNSSSSSSSEEEEDDDVHKVNLTPKELAIGQAIKVDNKKHIMEDNSYNRYSFQDGDNMPDWFIEDEKKYNSRPQEVPKDVVEYYKQRMRELNARPIKKVAEAKARKKMKALRKLEQMKKKAESIVNNNDMNELSKSRALQSMYKKARAKKPKEMTYVVASKSGAQKRPQRPKGLTGAYKMVDPRMKKDKLAMQRAERRKKKGKVSRKK